MILAEFQTEFKFRQNGSRNHPGGMLARMRQNRIFAEPLFVDDACSIWASSTNNHMLSQLPLSSTMPTHLAHHHHQWSPPTPTHNSQTPPTMKMACPETARATQQHQVATHSLQTRVWSIAQKCHVTVSDMAINEQRHQSTFIVFVPGEYSPPCPSLLT